MNGHTNFSHCPGCGLSLVSAKEAATIIGVSYSRVRAILASDPDRLEAFKVGRSWLIPESAARAFQPFPPHRPRSRSMEK